MRLYFDENFAPQLVRGFHEFERGRPSEGIEVRHLTDEFARGTPDEEWLPGLASRHGCVLTQDLNISRTRLLWQLCEQNRIGIFFFRQPKKRKLDYWGWITKVFEVWPEIKGASKERSRPFAFVVEPHKAKLIDVSQI
jgi:PIN like domain